jgi:phosphatidylinositol phospholipase C beta
VSPPSSQVKSGLPSLPGVPGVSAKKPQESRDEVKFEPLTPDSLKTEKSFVKLTKKHNKELETMRKKHQKERTLVQKNQCSAIDKLVKSKGK